MVCGNGTRHTAGCETYCRIGIPAPAASYNNSPAPPAAQPFVRRQRHRRSFAPVLFDRCRFLLQYSPTDKTKSRGSSFSPPSISPLLSVTFGKSLVCDIKHRIAPCVSGQKNKPDAVKNSRHLACFLFCPVYCFIVFIYCL